MKKLKNKQLNTKKSKDFIEKTQISTKGGLFITALVFLSSLTTIVLGRNFFFTDHSEIPDWAEDSVYNLQEVGVIQGYAGGSFQPNNPITRAEAAVILNRYEEYLVEKYGLEVVEGFESGNIENNDDQPVLRHNDQSSDQEQNELTEDQSAVLGANSEIEFLAEELKIPSGNIEVCENPIEYYFSEAFMAPPGKNSDFSPTADLFNQLDTDDYQICILAVDQYLMAPKNRGTGLPVVALNIGAARDYIAEIPHPFFEDLTLEQGLAAFEDFDARALIVNGSHRCASGEYSSCDGVSPVCDGTSAAYRASDPAHNTNTLFHDFHRKLTAEYPEAIVLNIHGMSGDGVSISNGTKLSVETKDPVGRIYQALQSEFPQEKITTCNGINGNEGANVEERYCGTTNVQGRHLNGSSNACEDSAQSASQKFIHLEQSLDLRRGNFKKVLETIVNAL